MAVGRTTKQVIDESGRDKRSLGYYSTPAFVTEYLTQRMLEQNPQGTWVLDPCVGREEMVGPFVQAGKRVLGLDIVDYGGTRQADFAQQDFIEYYAQQRPIIAAQQGLDFDYYIANPPYNCHESSYIRKRKDELQQLFPDIGTLNMYSLFLAAMVDCAKPGALLGVITSDSFLTNRLHKGLRNFVRQRCYIHELLLCPTDMFRDQQADVRTCLLLLEKRQFGLGRLEHGVTETLGRPVHEAAFVKALQERRFRVTAAQDLFLDGHRDHGEWLVDCPAAVARLFEGPRLGDAFRCVTGVSTGSDRTYLRATSQPGWAVPFYKNPGKRRFFAGPDGYLPDDYLELGRSVPNFLIRNRSDLGRAGIACSSMGVAFAACYRPEGAVFGVNANFVEVDDDLWWLLAYLNSSLVTYFVRGVLLRSNMITSGYVSRIPLVNLRSDAKNSLADLARREYRRLQQGGARDEAVVSLIDQVVFAAASLESKDIQHIQAFCADLVRRT